MKWIILENSNIIRYGYSVGYILCVDKIDILIKLDYKKYGSYRITEELTNGKFWV